MKNFFKILIFIVLLFLTPFIFLAFVNFGGNKIYYVFFTLISFFSVIFSFREKGFFFEKFFSIYLWLGLWLKFTLFRSIFLNNPPGGIGFFEFNEESLNELMVLASIPFLSLTLSSIIFSKFNYNNKFIPNNFWSKIYKNFRLLILIILIILISVITLLNLNFGIYQKGLVSNLDLPFVISGFFKWFYLIGSGVIISLIIKYELEIKKNVSHLLYGVLLFETFISNITLLSRAMIFNISAIFYGIFQSLILDKENKQRIKKLFVYYLIVIILFLVSVPVINQIREKVYYVDDYIKIEKAEVFGQSANEKKHIKKDRQNNEKEINKFSDHKFLENKIITNTFFKAVQLIYIRFVGIESLMAVSSYENKSFLNLIEAFDEKIDYSNYNYYYTKYVLVEQKKIDENFTNDKKYLTKNQYTIHVPGIVSFLYYAGSKTFLFFSIFLIGILFFYFEKLVFYSSSGNIILTAFISHIISYRLAHFGYVPTQSYLFFGSLIITIFVIFLFNKYFK